MRFAAEFLITTVFFLNKILKYSQLLLYRTGWVGTKI